MTRTAKKLEELTDAGKFEELANSVLRLASADYKGIIGTGSNNEGKTVKSPIDGICFVPDTTPTKVFVVHHSTCKRTDLEKKWLYDNATKNKQTKTPDGDIIKTIKWLEKQKKTDSSLKLTLILTTNRIPSESLICEAKAKCRQNMIEVDFWDNSRITCFLDNNPDGQWIRKKYLGIEQERLSENLLVDISKKSVEEYESTIFISNKSILIERQMDINLSENIQKTNLPLTFLVAESGLGKSIASFHLLENHIRNGGTGIHISHDLLSDKPTSFQSLIDKTLKTFCPKLETEDFVKILSSWDDKFFLIIIDDVNSLKDTEQVLKKIVSWLCNSEDSGSLHPKYGRNIKVICPVWPHHLKKIEDILKKVKANIVYWKTFEKEDALKALTLAAQKQSSIISRLEAENIVKYLNYNPLLIGLWTDCLDLESSQNLNHSNYVISSYIEKNIGELSNGYFASEYRSALDTLGEYILINQILEPDWQSILKYFKNDDNVINQLRNLLNNKSIICLNDDSSLMKFRHDRVRDYILAHSICSLMQQNTLKTSILKEPFYAEFIGLALLISEVKLEWIESVKNSNPLALFYALKIFGKPSTDWQHKICSSIVNWIDNYPKLNILDSLLHEIQFILSETDSPLVNEICNKFNDKSRLILEAKFRNGDIESGAYYCYQHNFSTNFPHRDVLIDHVNIKYNEKLRKDISCLLKQKNIDIELKKGALNLCGYLADIKLIPAIKECWNSCRNLKSEILSSAIWAASRCCGINPEETLDSMFEHWNTLSDEKKEFGTTDVMDVAYYNLSFAFKSHQPQESAILYFIKKMELKKLSWPLTMILEEINHPDAIEYIVREAAKLDEKLKDTEKFSPWLTTLDQNWYTDSFRSTRKLCPESKIRLLDLWSNEKESNYVRKWAMKIWLSKTDNTHIDILRKVKDGSPLYDLALKRRIVLGDRTVEDEVIKKIKTDQTSYLWQVCHHCWSAKLNEILNICINQRFNIDDYKDKGHFDWCISRLLMKISVDDAEALIEKYWKCIQDKVEYFQAALYIGTKTCRKLTSETLKKHSEPEKLFQHINQRFGFNTYELKDLITQKHLDSLEPYLDFLSDMAILDIWTWCNKYDFIKWRKNYLDNRLSSEWKKRELLTDEANFEELSSFTQKIKNGRIFGYRWLERFEERNESIDRAMSLLNKWLDSCETLDAFKVAADIISSGGSRSNLSILDITISGVNEKEIDFIRENTSYQVKRRTLK